MRKRGRKREKGREREKEEETEKTGKKGKWKNGEGKEGEICKRGGEKLKNENGRGMV